MKLEQPFGWGIFIAFVVVFVIYMVLVTFYDTSATKVPRELSAMALGGLFIAGVVWIIWRLARGPKTPKVEVPPPGGAFKPGCPPAGKAGPPPAGYSAPPVVGYPAPPVVGYPAPPPAYSDVPVGQLV
jgi:hypothetical protein